MKGGWALAGIGRAMSAQTADQGAGGNRPWMDRVLDADVRAALLEAELTESERLGLLHCRWATGLLPQAPTPEGAIPGAGYTAPITRLGAPGLFETDASLGVTNPGARRAGDSATAFPSGLAMASTWNPDLIARTGGAVAREARERGFNVLLGGGVNLARDPRCGRNFEYLGEDPLLAGVLAGGYVRAAQAQGVICTLKHYVLNDQETGRHVLNAVIDEAALRESDLFAFQIAIEIGDPGAIMTAYNRINGDYACANRHLLEGVLKGDWGYRGFVMSDWGATSGIEAAAAGLDRQSGEELDYRVWFDEPLRLASQAGELEADRAGDMARRILRSMFACGLFDAPGGPEQSRGSEASHAGLAREVAAQGCVLLRNEGAILPLAGEGPILVVGGLADVGVPAGGGSSQVVTGAGHAAQVHVGGEGAMMAMAIEAYHPSSPWRAIRARAGSGRVRFCNGRYLSEAARMAAEAEVVIVFANQWMTEGADAPDLGLPSGQDALIATVAKANPRTVVVLQTGGPVLMPWLGSVAGVMQAWYAGGAGGQAICDLLFGDACPSGRLPMTFPASEQQLPRPHLPGLGRRWASPAGARLDLRAAPGFDVPHDEGSDVGYRWFARTGQTPLFPFGFGLSYARFEHGDLQLQARPGLEAVFSVRNASEVAGTDVPQLYLVRRGDRPMRRLLGWARLDLAPGETRQARLRIDPRLLADFDVAGRCWSVPESEIEIALGSSAAELPLRAVLRMPALRLDP